MGIRYLYMKKGEERLTLEEKYSTRPKATHGPEGNIPCSQMLCVGINDFILGYSSISILENNF